MNKPKILLTAIIKDDSEYDIAERMIESFKPHVDGLFIGLTGVSGKFKKLIKLINKNRGNYIITSPETHPKIYNDGLFANFAEARNIVFEEADKLEGYNWYTWADVDDVLVGGEELRFCARKAIEGKFDAVFFTYWYAIRLKEDRTFGENDVQIEHTRERLLRPKMFKWVSRLHEVAVPKDGHYKPLLTEYKFNSKEDRFLVWAHVTNDQRSVDNMDRNIKILELQIKEEEGKDPRTLFYLAKTYYDMRSKEKDELALLLLEDYREKSGWAEERASSWEYTANILGRRGRHKEAVEALHKAAQEYPDRHMNYLLLAKEYAELGLNEHSSFWLDVVLRMDAPEARTTIGNPLEVKYIAAALKYNEAIRKIDLNGAIHWLKVKLELGHEKDDGMLKTLEESKLLNDTAISVFNYAKWLKDHGHTSKIKALLESLPIELGREAFAHHIANEIKEPYVWGEKEICYFASWGVEHFEEWSPKSMDKGIGGSETAVIELAKQWVKLGFKVTVFGDPRDNAGEYEGVTYKPWYEANWRDEFNILILWRSPHLLDRDIKAKKLFYDAHDVESQLNWTDERMKKVDKVFFKSKFHRGMVPKLPDDKVAIISNGINI